MRFPEGWFQVSYSDDLPVGGVRPLHYFGEELVLFRLDDREAQVFDAYCTHLGAHLGHGGRVDGTKLRCPFHAWAYDRDGVCVDIPYCDRIPRNARMRAWPTTERSGIVWVWYSPDGRAPSWQPPALDEYDDPAWTGYLRHQRVFRSMVREIVENVFDVPHGQFVHQNANGTAPAEATFSFDGHTAVADFRLETPLVGGKTEHRVVVHGPAITVNRSIGHGAKSFFTCYTPVDEHTVETNFSFMTPRQLPDDPDGQRSLASAIATTRLFEQDVPIWENKIYRSTPLLCDGDSGIARYRAWARQFDGSAAARS